MNISLDQAIEIHARVLKYRRDRAAPFHARKRAAELKLAGDFEGHAVWLLVAETAERLLVEAPKARTPRAVLATRS
jgi:hypothetical protein